MAEGGTLGAGRRGTGRAPVPDRHASDLPAAGGYGVDFPAAGGYGVDFPAADEHGVDFAVADGRTAARTGADGPAAGRFIADRFTADGCTGDGSAVDGLPVGGLTVGGPVASHFSGGRPATERPAADGPAVGRSVVGRSVVDGSLADPSATDRSRAVLSAPDRPWATAGIYPTTEEQTSMAKALAAAHPGILRLRTVGVSRSGRPLWLLSAGRGCRNVFTVAGAHSNEPVGGASAIRLAGQFALDPDVLDGLDCTWHFLLCLDPDGMSISERHGWPFEGWGVEGYHRHFYRQEFACQPEFRPLGGWPAEPLPESDVLVGLLDELRPAVQFSLHGGEAGGTFLQLTRSVPGAARAFREVAAGLRVPVEHRPFDGMGWFVEGPGVLVLPGAEPADERDASGFTSEATWTYPMRHGTVTAVVEAPMWVVDSVADPRRTAGAEEHIARVSRTLLERSERVEAALGRAVGPVAAELLPYDTAARELLGVGPGVADTWKSYLADDLGGVGLATTVGNSVSLDLAARRIPLRAAAMLRQALGDPPADPVAAGALDALVREWCRELETCFGARWLPVRGQTALHGQTMLRLARILLSG